MAFEKNYPNRKDWRKYNRNWKSQRAKFVCRGCRPHGICDWCQSNRQIQSIKAEQRAEEEMAILWIDEPCQDCGTLSPAPNRCAVCGRDLCSDCEVASADGRGVLCRTCAEINVDELNVEHGRVEIPWPVCSKCGGGLPFGGECICDSIRDGSYFEREAV